MKIAPFELEDYFAKYEFSARYLLSSSDCEPFSMNEILGMADQEAKQLWEELMLGYTETMGHPLLRETIAHIYDGISPDDVLVVVPEEGIFLLMHALLEQGDHVVCTFPGYQSLYEIARSIGCEVSTWEPNEDQGWRFDLSQLEEMIRPDTKLVVVNFPHNPTGYLPALKDYEDLLNLVQRRGVYLLSDEMYRFLEINPDSTLPSACEIYDRAFSLFGLSKTFGLPGLRLGWIVSRNSDVLTQITKLKYYTTICASAPSEILGIIALRSRGVIITRQLARIKRNVAVLDEFFDEYDDCFSWNRPAGGSICFPRLLITKGADEFCENLIRDEGIMLVSSSVFQYGNRHVRVGFGRENLPEVINRFSDALSSRYR